MLSLFLFGITLLLSRLACMKKLGNLYQCYFFIFSAIFLMEWIYGFISLVLYGAHMLFLTSVYYYRIRGNNKKSIVHLGLVFLALVLGLGIIERWEMSFVKNIKTSFDAPFFSLHINKSKAFVGAIIFIFFAEPMPTLRELKKFFRAMLPLYFITALLLFLLACFLGFVRLDLKVPSYTLQFLIINFLFVCIVEEAFFRFLIQDGIVYALKDNKMVHFYAVCISAIFFGVVHAGGGGVYVLLSSLAGFGYAYSYFKIRFIEAPILLHFLINMTHFFCFTYPYLER